MTTAPKKPWPKHEAPPVCTDCQGVNKQGQPIPPPALVRSSPTQNDYKCPNCGLLHVAGLPPVADDDAPQKGPKTHKKGD